MERYFTGKLEFVDEINGVTGMIEVCKVKGK
jgi:hypothetical protein